MIIPSSGFSPTISDPLAQRKQRRHEGSHLNADRRQREIESQRQMLAHVLGLEQQKALADQQLGLERLKADQTYQLGTEGINQSAIQEAIRQQLTQQQMDQQQQLAQQQLGQEAQFFDKELDFKRSTRADDDEYRRQTLGLDRDKYALDERRIEADIDRGASRQELDQEQFKFNKDHMREQMAIEWIKLGEAESQGDLQKFNVAMQGLSAGFDSATPEDAWVRGQKLGIDGYLSKQLLGIYGELGTKKRISIGDAQKYMKKMEDYGEFIGVASPGVQEKIRNIYDILKEISNNTYMPDQRENRMTPSFANPRSTAARRGRATDEQILRLRNAMGIGILPPSVPGAPSGF